MAELFSPNLIPHLKGVVNGPLVAVPNGSDACWATDNEGKRWVRKQMMGSDGMLAEALSYLLGRHLGVRQPEGAVFHDGVEWNWMSRAIPAVSEHWHPDLRDLIENIDEVGRMIALDALVANGDRHPRNILAQPQQDAAHLRLWSIDMANALVGQPEDFLRLALGVSRPNAETRGLPVEILRKPALEAAQVARNLSEEVLRGMIEEACWLAQEPESAALLDALLGRCRHAPQIISGYLDTLGALP